MGTHSDDESQSRKKLKSSETNANSGMRFNAQESCIQFSLGKCTYGEKCRYVHDIGNVNQITTVVVKSNILPNDPQNAAPVKTRAHGNAEVRRIDLDSSTGYAASKNAEPESQRGKFPAKLGNLKKNSQVYGDWIQDLD